MTPKLQLLSSLSNVYVLDPMQQHVRRTTVLTVGFNKTVSATPRWLIAFHPPKRVIRGRVYRDLNVNVIFNTGEPGLTHVRVDLSSGQSTLTDAQGQFEFTGLAQAAYRVSVPLKQFAQAVRVTSAADVRIDLIQEKTGEVNFGIVNFACVEGNVFNDYLLTAKKQPDATGVGGIKLTLTGEGVHREVVSNGSGDYELFEVAPGDYQLNMDRSSLPANYVALSEAVNVHVTPVSTIVQDIPVQALRSVSGHVYFKAALRSSNGTSASGLDGGYASGKNGGKSSGRKGLKGSDSEKRLPGVSPEADTTAEPLAGVQVIAKQAVATTDADGAFVLRNVPAGELTVQLVPNRPLPPGLTVPTGRIKLPFEPIQVENAAIIISTRELLSYISPVVPEKLRSKLATALPK